MVKRVTPEGSVYYEPPYTPAEEAEFYRQFAGAPVATLRGPRPAADTLPEAPRPPPPEEPPLT